MSNHEIQGNEYTMMEALNLLYRHTNKKQPLIFSVTFDSDKTRAARFGKVWRKIEKGWMYSVQDGPNEPGFLHNERAAVSAIMRIKGMNLIGNYVDYHIHMVDSSTPQG